MRKRSLVLVIVLFVIIVGIASIELARQAYFYPNIPLPDYPPPGSRTEAWQQDLDYLETYIGFNRPYTDETRDAALDVVSSLSNNVESLSDAELKLGVAEAIALSQNGHSFVRLSDLTLSEGRIPLMGHMFADGYYVLWTTPQYEDLLGAQIISIDGTPIEAVIEAFRPYSGARESYFRLYVPWLLETPSLVHAVGYADSPSSYVLGIEHLDRASLTEVEVTVDPSITVPIVNPNDILTPLDLSPFTGLPEDLHERPFFLHEWEDVFYVQTIESVNGLYIRYGANSDVDDHRIKAFNRTIRTTLKQHDFDLLIVDQRDNNGGDYTHTYNLMTRLPELVGEEVPIYIITGPQTFSAGISSVAFLKANGGEQVTIIGARMGDTERHWGETSVMTLPNSQLDLQLATGLHDYAEGCQEFPQCYWLDFYFNVAAGDLSPENPIPFTFEDYITGSDAAIEFILQRSDTSRGSR